LSDKIIVEGLPLAELEELLAQVATLQKKKERLNSLINKILEIADEQIHIIHYDKTSAKVRGLIREYRRKTI